jgi:hypothetical protein
MGAAAGDGEDDVAGLVGAVFAGGGASSLVQAVIARTRSGIKPLATRWRYEVIAAGWTNRAGPESVETLKFGGGPTPARPRVDALLARVHRSLQRAASRLARILGWLRFRLTRCHGDSLS